jgi:Flp pilus assembly pilin Flp
MRCAPVTLHNDWRNCRWRLRPWAAASVQRSLEVGNRVHMMKTMEIYLRVREAGRRLISGQAMTEYALILAAIAVVIFITYEVMGQDVGKLSNRVDSSLTTS